MLFNDINWLSKKGSRCKRTDLELWLNLLCSSTSPETRYVVQDDAPEDHSGPLPWVTLTVKLWISEDVASRSLGLIYPTLFPSNRIWNTTLKAVVPLPININTLPEKDYPVGSQVMGLYPDTSCFYRAIIKGGGPGMEQALRGNPAKVSWSLSPYWIPSYSFWIRERVTNGWSSPHSLNDPLLILQNPAGQKRTRTFELELSTRLWRW